MEKREKQKTLPSAWGKGPFVSFPSGKKENRKMAPSVLFVFHAAINLHNQAWSLVTDQREEMLARNQEAEVNPSLPSINWGKRTSFKL